jgi:mRNA interferase MazF
VRRGDIVLTVLPGDYGKPRPAVVVQGDGVIEVNYGSIVVCPLTSDIDRSLLIRVPVAPSAENGLDVPSEIMVEKLAGVSLKRLREVIGRLDGETQRKLDHALLVLLGFAEPAR